MFVTDEVVGRLAALPVIPVREKAARLLLRLSKLFPEPGVGINTAGAVAVGAIRKTIDNEAEGEVAGPALDPLESLAIDLLGAAAARNGAEFDWLITEALETGGLVKLGRMFTYDKQGFKSISITPQGWREVERLQQTNSASRTAFVAMAFADEFVPLYVHGIARGIAAAGYDPVRVDRAEHNNRIDDEIIVRIKQSRFLVADFTKDRGGIYFEAGFAMGLGLPVIWLAREDALSDVHFDNRQYNFVTWNEGAWDKLSERLRLRIEATIGRGPLATAE